MGGSKSRLSYLIEAARRTRTVDFEWASELCQVLSSMRGSDAEAREAVLRILKEVEEKFSQSVEAWQREGFDYEEELWPLYRRLLDAAEVLAKRFDAEATEVFCRKLVEMKVAAEKIAVAHLFGA